MKIQKSELEIINFNIIKSEFLFNPLQIEGEINRLEVFNELEVDLDFSIHSPNKQIVLIFTKCQVNKKEDPKPGYYLFAEGVTVFNVEKAKIKLEEKDFKNLVEISGLSIAINNVRNYLQQITIAGPLKEYILPAVNLGELLEQKFNSSNKETEA